MQTCQKKPSVSSFSPLPVPRRPQSKKMSDAPVAGDALDIKRVLDGVTTSLELAKDKRTRRSVGCRFGCSVASAVCVARVGQIGEGQTTMAVNTHWSQERWRGDLCWLAKHTRRGEAWCWTSTNSESQDFRKHAKGDPTGRPFDVDRFNWTLSSVNLIH